VLDRLRSLSYIGAGVWSAACVPKPRLLVPEPLAPAAWDSARQWTARTSPSHSLAIRFRWKYRDERLSAAGRGQVRIAPPDSLRLDYVAQLGVKSGAGVVVGDSVRWADPEKDFRSLVPAIPMLWAALGIVRPPAVGAAVSGRADRGVDYQVTTWRFVQEADTLDYVESLGRTRGLEAQWRRAGKVVATSSAKFDGRALPASARIDFFSEGPARFELTMVAVDTAAVIAPALWRSRR
jgi:hypothetical protein